jgi:hypothetical protein
MARGEVHSVRLDSETAAGLRWAAGEAGTTASELIRRALRPVLAQSRALWYEKHGTGDDWEVVAASPAPPRGSLDSSFSVRVTGEQLHELLAAAGACGVPLSAFMGQAALALAASMAAGGTARCQHMSIAPVTSARCGQCGPLPVACQVTAGA